jgi:hypothetical protein
VAAGALVFLLIKPGMFQVPFGGYLDEFQPYKDGLSTPEAAGSILAEHGWLAWGFAALGAWWARKGPAKAILGLLLLHSLIALLLFSNVQKASFHHQYPFTILLVLLQSLFLEHLWRKDLGKPLKIILTTLFALHLAFNFLQALVPQTPWKPHGAGLWVERDAHPLKRGDLAEVKRVVEYLSGLPRPVGSIYVLASSESVNASTFKNASYYMGFEDHDLPKKFFSTFDIDLRDGFPWPLFRASHVLVADPIQVHLQPGEQLILILPAEQLLSGEGIGRAFRRLPGEFALDHGVKLKVFERSGKVKFDDLRELNRRFLAAHPHRADLFGPDVLEKMAPPSAPLR